MTYEFYQWEEMNHNIIHREWMKTNRELDYISFAVLQFTESRIDYDNL